MSHPLLTATLETALHGGQPMYQPGSCDDCRADVLSWVERIPPDIADRLERALDVCAVCGHPRDGHDFTPPNDCHATPTCDCGPFQPLVTP